MNHSWKIVQLHVVLDALLPFSLQIIDELNIFIPCDYYSLEARLTSKGIMSKN